MHPDSRPDAPRIGRRSFLVGCGCLLAPDPAFAALRRLPICGTPDVDETVSAPRLLPNGFPLLGATLDPSKLWTGTDGATPGTDKITLNVAFFGGTLAQRRAVRRIAPQWLEGPLGRRVAFRFGTTAAEAQIRITFNPDLASVSSVGRDSLKKTPAQSTMNLSVVDQRDVLHEFGHALGLKHEHQHPNSGIRWNKPVVLAALKARNNWGPEMVEENVFKHFSKNCVCIGDPAPDPDSIMLYPIQPEWTLDHRGTKYNRKLSKRDRGCLEREYGVA